MSSCVLSRGFVHDTFNSLLPLCLPPEKASGLDLLYSFFLSSFASLLMHPSLRVSANLSSSLWFIPFFIFLHSLPFFSSFSSRLVLLLDSVQIQGFTCRRYSSLPSFVIDRRLRTTSLFARFCCFCFVNATLFRFYLLRELFEILGRFRCR